METKHTKGEWKYSPLSNFSDTLVSYISSGSKPIAQLRGCTTGEESEAIANAKLIAAAPLMYEALKELYNAIDSCIDLTPYVLNRANIALKKAVE